MVLELGHKLIFLSEHLKENKFLWLSWLAKKKKNSSCFIGSILFLQVCESLNSNLYWQLPIGERQP